MPNLIHGIEVVELTDGIRPITTARSSVIGLVGTAPEASASGDYAFDLNTPVLVTSARAARQLIFNDAAGEGTDGGTLLDALDAIFAQAGALLVMVRVEEGADEAATATNAAGSSSARTGAYALLNAESVTGLKPRILCAPAVRQFYDNSGTVAVSGVPAALLAVAKRLRAVAILDGTNSDLADITAAEALVASERDRAFLVDPWVMVDGVAKAPSAFVAGLIAKVDNEMGFWHSPSNKTIGGITGTARAVDFALGDPICEADVLNGLHVATIVRQDGFRLWGNRTLYKTDALWRYLSVRRIADLINDSLVANHLWAVDHAITRNYLGAVTAGVDAYLRHLQSQGAILGGRCYADPELNTPEAIASGRVYFDFDFTPVYPAELVQFRAHLVNDYIQEILP